MLKKWLGIPVVFVALVLIFGGNLAAEEEVPKGAWVDEVIIILEDSVDAAITQIEAGEMDVYADGSTDANLYQRVLESDELTYIENFGGYRELTYNTVGPVFDNDEFNPFAEDRIREATNYIIDREYIVDEIYGGLGRERFLPFSTVFPDYARHIEKFRELETEYAYNPDKGEEIIAEEMKEMGAEMVDGLWHYEDEPVELIFLIRNDDERLEIGDYVATEFEDIGFEVRREYGTPDDLNPIWQTSDPWAGGWHIYTGGWLATVVDRDQNLSFDQFYTDRILAWPPHMAYDPDPEFDEIADRVASRDFDTLEERGELIERGTEMALETSKRVYLTDDASFVPMHEDISVAYDLAGGISGAYLWAYTIRDEAEGVGGTVNIGLPDVMTEPWNAPDGSNWVFDMMLVRALMARPTEYDPFTGLNIDHFVEDVTVTVQEDQPIEKTLDWLELERKEEIEVPEDTKLGWDPEEQVFGTVGEEHPEGLTANRKVRWTIPNEVMEEMTFHDGSQMDLADMILPVILSYDRAKEESAVFDENTVSAYESFIADFRGFRVLSEDPVTFEYYSDMVQLDAETAAQGAIWSLFPFYDQGGSPWHTLGGLGMRVEAEGDAAHTSAKADTEDIEHLNMIGGPSLDYLERELEAAKEEAYIPYEPTLGEYISEEDARERYENAASFYEEYGHFMIGNGPLFLREAHHVEGIVELERYEDYPFPADLWDRFEEPMRPEVDVSGPSVVEAGEDATFEAEITFEGEPYAVENIESVSYLAYDAYDELVISEEVEATEDGRWELTIPAEAIEEMPTGSAKIEVVAISELVAMPTIEDTEFVVYR